VIGLEQSPMFQRLTTIEWLEEISPDPIVGSQNASGKETTGRVIKRHVPL
jgi:hypothetical protein